MAEEGFFLGLGPWPNVYINMGSPICYPLEIFLFFPMGGKEDLDVMIVLSRPFCTMSDCKTFF